MFKVKAKFKRALLASTLVTAGTLGMLMTTPSTAWAGTSGSEIYASSPYPPLIEVPGWSTASGTGLDLWQENSQVVDTGVAGANQKWSMPTNGNGGFDGATGYVQNQYSGMCIETDYVPGHAVYQAPCNGSARQQWHFSNFQVWSWADLNWVNYYHITNPASGLELNANQDRFNNGTAVIVWPSQGQNVVDNEAWQLVW